MSLDKDVAIKFTNKTGETDFSVIVFASNEYTVERDGEYKLVSFKVLRTKSTSQFVYPVNSTISASYRQNGQLITAGPIPATPGKKYEIIMKNKYDTAIIREQATTDTNPDGAISIQNVRPTGWYGRLFDGQLSKGGNVLLQQYDIHAGNKVVFQLKPILRFAVARNANLGEVMLSWEMSSDVFDVDLRNYENGVEVILEEIDGVSFKFSAVSLEPTSKS